MADIELDGTEDGVEDKQQLLNEQQINCTIIDTVREAKDRTIEILIASLFICAGLVFFALGNESLLTLCVLLFGALWNYFTPSNRLFACIFAFFVCVPYSLVAIDNGLYGQAFLHILLYLPTQLMFYYSERDKKESNIDKNKTIGAKSVVVIYVFSIITCFALALVLYSIKGEEYFWFDAISVVLLAISVFFVNGHFKEYWVERIIADAVALSLWLTQGILFNFAEGTIMFSLLFGMYLVLDIYRFIVWQKENYPSVEKKLKKIKKEFEDSQKKKEALKSKPLPE